MHRFVSECMSRQWLITSSLLLTLSVLVSSKPSQLRLKNVTDSPITDGILLSGKAFFSNYYSGKPSSLLIRDYCWQNKTEKTDADVLLDFETKALNEHRLVSSSAVFGGTLHSALGYIMRKFAKPSRVREKATYKTYYEYRPSFYSACNFIQSTPRDHDFLESYLSYPATARVSSPDRIYSISSLLLSEEFKVYTFEDIPIRKGFNVYKVCINIENCFLFSLLRQVINFHEMSFLNCTYDVMTVFRDILSISFRA